MKKVAFMFGSLNRGGLETLMLDVFRNAAKADFDFIGIYRKSGKLEDEFVKTGVPMLKLRPKNVFDLGYCFKMRRLLKRNEIDIVHSQTPLDAAIALAVTIGTKIKVLTTYHSNSMTKRQLVKMVLKYVDLNLYVSEYQKDKYIEMYDFKHRAKHVVINNGVSFDKFPMPNRVRTESQDVLRIGTVGSFSSGRAQIVICRFLKLLKERDIRFRFYFVGSKTKAEPELFDACVRYCEENNLMDSVSFMGLRDDVPQLLQQWNAYIYSTEHDSFGISVVEAIASGLPTFVNDWPVMKEITNDGEFASIYKSKDENDLLDKFIAFLNDQPSYYGKAFVAAEQVRNIYSIERYIEKLSDSYRGLM